MRIAEFSGFFRRLKTAETAPTTSDAILMGRASDGADAR
jgi:hypothetical protein